MTKIEDKFKFWCPIEKAQETIIDPTTGEEVMRLGGIASTFDKDSDGEFLDPKGFDIKPLIESGMVNWHHQAKGQPASIIGEPSKAEIRPEGLYLETDLYPSSQIARDVWELANTLERDSKTRRLGSSIEGRVVKRKSNNKNHPDYKIILKAVITGVAITHQPKNPKTFANIIKGETDDDFEDEEEKAIDTESAAPLKKESVDKKMKVQTFSKSEVMEMLFKDIPAISIEKAEKIHLMLKKIAHMKGIKHITEDDITKAYEALGLDVEPNDIQKGEDETSDEETSEEKKPIEKAKPKKEDSDSEETEEEGGVEKGGNGGNRFDRLEKAIAASHQINSKYIKALGVMLKDATQKLDSAAEREIELMDIVKAQDETISVLSEKIEAFGSDVPAPKSVSSSRVIDRHFDKGNEDELNKGGQGDPKAISMSRQKRVVSQLLDEATFAKGYDEEFSKACTSFEASGVLPKNIIARIKNETGYTIVQ